MMISGTQRISAGTMVAGAATLCTFAACAQALVASMGSPVPSTTTAVVPVVTGASTAPIATPKLAATATVPMAAAAATAGAQSSAAVPAPDVLPPLNLSDMRLWNWAGVWHASEWDNGESPLPWRFNHIRQPARADTTFTLDAMGAPQLQAEGGTPAAASGLWETEVTLPTLRAGLVVAPLWLYDPGSRDEVDFELPGRQGLDVSLHAYVNGAHRQSTVRLFPNRDLSGQRHRFGIRVDQGAGVVEMYVDGERVHSWNRGSMSFFVSKPLKPWIEMWAANPTNAAYVQWAGKWTGASGTDPAIMIVHGYRYSMPR